LASKPIFPNSIKGANFESACASRCQFRQQEGTVGKGAVRVVTFFQKIKVLFKNRLIVLETGYA
jgi:hypothetical protein